MELLKTKLLLKTYLKDLFWMKNMQTFLDEILFFFEHAHKKMDRCTSYDAEETLQNLKLKHLILIRQFVCLIEQNSSAYGRST